jgi:hypothetical protein
MALASTALASTMTALVSTTTALASTTTAAFAAGATTGGDRRRGK